jgi:hypothetical protein
MKNFLLTSAAVALVVGASLSAAAAQTTAYSPGETSQAMSQPADTGSTNIDAPDTGVTNRHYEYQYHYGGSPRHPRWESEPVPVK